MTPYWWGFLCGMGAMVVLCTLIGLVIPLVLFCLGKGAIH